jgi:peptide/nickel transport system substrate-binding protein
MKTRIIAFLVLGLVMVGFVFGGGGSDRNAGSAQAGQSVSSGANKESPMLAEQVRAGKLPPLSERLPKEPLVVDKGYFTPGTMNNWQPGKFGGEIRVSHNEPNSAPDVFFMIMQPIIRLSNGLSDGNIQDNICHFLGASDGNKVFTFKIREGLKWSDGTPVTTEDVRFAYEDVTMNKELNSTVPSWIAQEGNAGKLVIVDTYTFRFSFEKQQGAFIRNVMINQWVEYSRIIKPAHYLKQFHVKYASAADIRKGIQEANLGDGATWLQLFLFKDAFNRNICSRDALGMPVLTPWRLVSTDNEVFVYERNPYYYKVDSAGQQLPYLDRIVSPKVQDGEMENMRMISGEADILRRNAALVRLPLYKENEARGRYTTLMLNSHLDAPSTLYFNFFFPDDTIRGIINDVRFRTALSLGVNKKEVIDTVYLGFGSIPTYTRGEFNPTEANNLLDQMGMRVGSNGLRTAPDGRPFQFLIETGGEAVDLLPSSEIMAAHLRENLKLDATIKKTDTAFFGQVRLANQIMTHMVWAFDHTLEDEYTTRNATEPTPVMLGYVDGNITIENRSLAPPEYLKELFRLYEQRMQLTYGTPEYDAHIRKEKEHYRTNVLAIPLIENSALPLPISNKFGNIPTGGYQIATLMITEHFFVK